MVQQMIDSKFNEYGLANTRAGFPICDKQQPIAVKKTALRDLQNDNRILVLKTLGNTSFLKDRGPITNAIKVSGTKRPTPECPPSPPCHQSSSNNGANGHLVYIRRRSEQELVKSNTCDSADNNSDCPQPRQFTHGEHETTWQQTHMQGSKISCFPAFAPIPMASLITFSSGGPSVPLSLGKLVNVLPPAEPNYPTVTFGVPPVIPQRANDEHWKERFVRLQTFLRSCENSSLDDYIQVLRSLPSVGRSRHAFELEKRAIQLLLEEGKELHRMKLLNVLGKALPKNNVSPTTPQVQSEK